MQFPRPSSKLDQLMIFLGIKEPTTDQTEYLK